MGLKERIASAAENLNLTERVFVSVGVDRKRMRPAPGTILVEVLGTRGETLTIDTFRAPSPAPKGPWHVNNKPATFVAVGETGNAHQAFSCGIDEFPVELPAHIRDKIDLGATSLNVWWSCEDIK
jgi:hypothetical protein